MSAFDREAILSSYGPGDPGYYLVAADAFLIDGKRRLAASALDRAYALAPDDPGVARQRAAILDALAVTVHGLAFRYVPAGTFLMGSSGGEADERPVHPRRLGDVWISEVPISWATYCRLLEWSPPPMGFPGEEDADFAEKKFFLSERNKIRRQYCADERAPDVPPTYERKPIVAVSPAEAEELALALSYDAVTYALPTEAEWEKAARGGREGCAYTWGDDPPTDALCDFDRLRERTRDPKIFPPNGYGLYGMCGGVAEWTSDRYDALAYRRAARGEGAVEEGTSRVLRGGSFTDCAAAVTVSFRMARADPGWRSEERLFTASPNTGFRLVRRVIAR